MTGHRIRLPAGTKTKAGKVKPRKTYTTKNRALKTARLAKAWASKSKGKS